MGVEGIGELGKTDFLNLLATQLRHQDPLNPVDNTEFIAQLAQFTALETAENTRAEVEKLALGQQQAVAAGLLGKQVAGLAGSVLFQGTVTGVTLSDGVPSLVVDGMPIALDDIVTISAQ